MSDVYKLFTDNVDIDQIINSLKSGVIYPTNLLDHQESKSIKEKSIVLFCGNDEVAKIITVAITMEISDNKIKFCKICETSNDYSNVVPSYYEFYLTINELFNLALINKILIYEPKQSLKIDIFGNLSGKIGFSRDVQNNIVQRIGERLEDIQREFYDRIAILKSTIVPELLEASNSLDIYRSFLQKEIDDLKSELAESKKNTDIVKKENDRLLQIIAEFEKTAVSSHNIHHLHHEHRHHNESFQSQPQLIGQIPSQSNIFQMSTIPSISGVSTVKQTPFQLSSFSSLHTSNAPTRFIEKAVDPQVQQISQPVGLYNSSPRLQHSIGAIGAIGASGLPANIYRSPSENKLGINNEIPTPIPSPATLTQSNVSPMSAISPSTSISKLAIKQPNQLEQIGRSDQMDQFNIHSPSIFLNPSNRK